MDCPVLITVLILTHDNYYINSNEVEGDGLMRNISLPLTYFVFFAF
jgi:hypothetical protein